MSGIGHLVVLPIVIPLLAAGLLLIVPQAPLAFRRGGSIVSVLLQLVIALLIAAATSDGSIHVYLLGNWAAPWGITLVADPLAALMLTVTALVGLASLFAAMDGADSAGPRFHGFLQLQLAGLNGAFLTGDLFNLFVFFEILLIASYALLLQAKGARPLTASLHYVVINLAGSVLFLLGVATLYGITGTLNMADLALRIDGLAPEDRPVVHAAGIILLVVFCLKGALLPLNFWLVRTYSAAPMAVAALFAVLTKVGIYAVARVHLLLYAPASGPAADAVGTPLLMIALITMAAASLGAVAARELRQLTGWLVIVSAATLLATIGLGTPAAASAALFYLVNSTLATAALFLVAGMVASQRDALADTLQAGPPVARPVLTGGLFFAAALAVIGLPPLAGFVAKAFLLAAAMPTPWIVPYAGVLLVSSLVATLALATAGSRLFWQTTASPAPAIPGPVIPGPSMAPGQPVRASAIASAGLLMVTLLLMAFPGPVYRFSELAGTSLAERDRYVAAVLSARPVPGGPTSQAAREASGVQPSGATGLHPRVLPPKEEF